LEEAESDALEMAKKTYEEKEKTAQSQVVLGLFSK